MRQSFFPFNCSLQGLPQKSHTIDSHISFVIRYELPVTTHPLLYVCVFGAVFPVQPGRGSNLAPRFTTRSNKDLVEREINNQINLRGGTNNTVRISTPPYSSANSHLKQKQIHRFEPDYVACQFRSVEISFSFPFPFILLLLSARWSLVSLSAGHTGSPDVSLSGCDFKAID